MTCCRSKQIEKKGDTRVERCVNPKAHVYLNVVDNGVCSGCPVRNACSSEQEGMPEGHRSAASVPDYPFCEHRQSAESGKVLKCGVTGLPVTPEQCNACDAETRDRVAKLGDKMIGYTSAIKRWVAAGRPTRSEEDIKRIFEEHCNKCEMYDREKHACRNCGCSLSTTGNPLKNKLAMATEKCPLGRW